MSAALLVDQHGNPARANPDAIEVLHPQREKGREAGRTLPDDKQGETRYLESIDAALTCLLDETTPENIAERVFENLMGVVEGYEEAAAIRPLQFLTRMQTDRVLKLPRGLRRAWLSEHSKAVRRWAKGGGSISGKRPQLPAIPGYNHGDALKG